jgi:hypothetical protein
MRKGLASQTLRTFPALALAIAAAALPTNDSLAVTSLSVSPTTYTLGDVTAPVTVQANTAAAGNELTFDVYIDVDGDGTLDPEDPLFMSFSAADGQTPHLGNKSFWHDEDGATNSSVKGTLAANGSWRFGGDFIVKVTDEDSSWATASLAVTQDGSYPCVVPGQVELDDGSPAAWAIVFIEHAADPSGVARDMASADGTFELRVKFPGTYTVLAFGPGISKFAEGSAQTIEVLEGTNELQQPLVLFRGNRTISGKVLPSDTGEGLGGVVVIGGSENCASAAVTDDDGDYALAVEDGEWEVRAELGHMYGLGYVPQEPRPAIVSGTDVQDVDLLCHRATTLIKGTITDANTQEAVQGCDIMVWGSGDGMQGGGYSGTDGTYAIGVVAGDWIVQFDGHRLFHTGYVYPPSQLVHAPAEGTVWDVDFALERFAVLGVGWTGQWPGGLDLRWTAERGATYRVFWSPGPLGTGTSWHEVPNAQQDMRQEGNSMIWTDKGTAPGMNGSPPGDPDIRQRFYRVKREWE